MPELRVLLVDPSSRGGLVPYTGMIARSLSAAGADVSVLGSRVIDQCEALGDRFAILVTKQGTAPDDRARFDQKPSPPPEMLCVRTCHAAPATSGSSVT